MKKIFKENLPKWENSFNKGKINWKESAKIKAKIKFTYDNIEGEVEIVDCDGKYLYIKYLDKEPFKIQQSSFINCQLGGLLGLINHEYKYKLNEIIVDVKSGKLQILEQIRMKSGENTEKGYKYQCLICGNIDTILETSLNNHNGCNICCEASKNIKIGYNDMWTTNPNLAKLLADPDDGYKYTQNSAKPVNWKCPDCGNIIKNKKISMINSYNLSCPKCGDGVSYPEKFMYNVLDQLQINFQTQLSKTTFKWCGKYKYDFYLPNIGIIIETHGIQHYEQTSKKSKKFRTVEKEQENDRLKKELALQNGIKEENYIVIDCRWSTLEHLKNNILIKLSDLFDLININWDKCHEFACHSLIKKACGLWNNGIHSTTDISKILKLTSQTICKYLKQGAKQGWCNYDVVKARKDGQRRNDTENNKKKVICLNNKIVYKSMTKAEKETNSKRIGTCCNNKANYSGISNKGEYLQWQYYEDFLINPKKLLTNDEIDKTNNAVYDKYRKKIICLNNKQEFNSIKEAEKFYNIQHIGACCQGKLKSAGKYPITKEKLHWMYYEDYLKLDKDINFLIN